MNQNENVSVENAIANPVPTTEQPKQETQENLQERNWRAFREQKEQERKQRIEAERIAKEEKLKAEALKAALEAVVNKPNQSNSDTEEISDDERIQRKVIQALNEKEKQYEEQRRIKEQQEFPQRLNQTYSDFSKVCTEENLDYLQYHYPEIANAYKQMPESFEKWSSIYQSLKRFITTEKKDQAKVDKNLMKPQAMSAAGATSTGDSVPHILDDKRRADNWKRMQRIMKGL